MNAGQLVFYLGLIIMIGSSAAIWISCSLNSVISARAGLYCLIFGLVLFAIGSPWGISG